MKIPYAEPVGTSKTVHGHYIPEIFSFEERKGRAKTLAIQSHQVRLRPKIAVGMP